MPGDFLKEYSKLNSDQKTAVDHIEGPVLVIAGPGTGKTQLLSLRAANILSKTDSLPENILCLTYSDSGAQAMKSRLIKMIGEDAYNINVSTYHSFGNDIIQNNLRYFSNQNLKPINALKSQIIIRDIIKQLPYDNNLAKLINVSKISKLIDDAKKSLLSPSDFQTIAKENISFIKEASKITKQVLTNLGVLGPQTRLSGVNSAPKTHQTSHQADEASATKSSSASSSSPSQVSQTPSGKTKTIDGRPVIAVYHMRATAYGPSLKDNYPYGPVDAFGQPLARGMVAVDPRLIPLKSYVYVKGYTDPRLPQGGFLGRAMDTGGAIKGHRIDIFMNANSQTVSNFGIEPVTVYVLGK